MSIDELREDYIWNEFKTMNERWLKEYYRRNCVLDGKWEKLDGERDSCKESNN